MSALGFNVRVDPLRAFSPMWSSLTSGATPADLDFCYGYDGVLSPSTPKQQIENFSITLDLVGTVPGPSDLAGMAYNSPLPQQNKNFSWKN